MVLVVADPRDVMTCGFGPRGVRQPRAVIALGTYASPDVRLAELAKGEQDSFVALGHSRENKRLYRRSPLCAQGSGGPVLVEHPVASALRRHELFSGVAAWQHGSVAEVASISKSEHPAATSQQPVPQPVGGRRQVHKRT